MPENSNHTHGDFCDLLAAYELGILENDDCLGFENHLLDCSACTEELFAMAPSVVAMRTQPGVYAEQVGRRPQTESLWARLNRLVFSGPAKVFVPVAVAAVLAMLIFMPQTTTSKYRNLAMTEAPAFSPIQVRAGAQGQWVPLWESGMDHYQNGDYGLAANDLDRAVNLLAKETDTLEERYAVLDNARMYLGVSRLLSGWNEESITVLTVAAQSRLRPVQQRSLWYLAQAHLVEQQPESALSVLKELQSSPVFGVRAVKLMNDIEVLMAE